MQVTVFVAWLRDGNSEVHVHVAALSADAFPFVSDDRAPAVPPLAVLAMADEAGRTTLAEALARSGFAVTVLGDTWALLDMLAGALFGAGVSQPPTLVVLDPALPGPSVATVRERVRRWFPDVELVEVDTPACERLAVGRH